MLKGYRITSNYGWRNDPINNKKDLHTGVDLVKEHKAVIHSFTDGQVIRANDTKTGYGKVVMIADKKGNTLLYAHLDSISVSIGQQVNKGNNIGRQGKTGRVTGSHLHLEVRYGISAMLDYKNHDAEGNTTDPLKYLQTGKIQNNNLSITEYLKSIGQDSTYNAREKLAASYGIKNYSGTAAQNIKLLDLLKSNKNKGDMKTGSIVNYLKSINVDSSYSNRMVLAKKYGVIPYSGTDKQNIALLKKIRG